MSQALENTLVCSFCQTDLAYQHNILGLPVCSFCLRQRPYDSANTLYIGEPDGFPDFSIEFEVASHCVEEREKAVILLKHQYLRTEDCTVSDEYKSPRYHSLEGFLNVLPTLHSLRHLVDSRCGTHIHLDCNPKIKARLMDEYDFCDALFGGLGAHLENHPDETIRFWGRFDYTLVRTHTRYNTIEFRKPKFRSAAQYIAVVKFCRQVALHIDRNFNPDASSYESLTPGRVGKDILDLYQAALTQAAQEGVYV